MSHKHKKSRRENYTIRAHELYERPRIIDPVNGHQIGPFGEGIKPSTEKTIENPLSQNSNGLERR